MEGAAVAELVVLSGARAGAVFELPEMPTVVGRSPEAHFQLDDPWISSMHAMFERRGAEIWVVDLESRNGTFLGTQRVSEALLPAGAVLRFGRTEVRMERDETRGRGRHQPRPTPPAGAPASRPTSRLGAPEITGPHGPVRARPEDALPLERRPVTLLRLAIHLQSIEPAPDAQRVRSAVELLQRAALAEEAVVLRQAGGALAVFGVAGPSPDDADLALRAAREALDQVESLGGDLAARAALDAGPVLLGDPYGAGGVELAVLGEVADRSERLLALARPGEILVGPGAAGAVGASAPVKMTIGGDDLSVVRAPRRA